jgi:multiple sugar transport system substrate-binding protein
MSHSRTAVRLIGIVMLLALVVSCAPAATPAPEPTTPPATSAPEATTPPEEPTAEATEPHEPVTIKLWKYASGMPNQGLFVQEAIEQYMEENPYVTIVYEEQPFATYGMEALPAAFAAGDAPDVFWATGTHVREFYEEGVLLPLDDYVTEDFKNDMDPRKLEANMYGGHLYRIAFETDATGLCIRTDLWDEMGMTDADIPTTWDELKDVAARLTTEDHYGIYLAPNPTNHSVWQFVSWMWMAGGEVVDRDLTTVYYDNPGTVAALQLWKDLMDAGSMVPTALGIGEAVGTGKAVMEFCASSHLGLLIQAYPDSYDLVRVIPLPLPEGGAKQDRYLVGGGYGLAVSNQGQHPDEAAKFAVWMFADPKDISRPVKWITWARPSLPPRQSVLESPEYQDLLKDDPRFAQFAEGLPHGRSELDAPAEIVQAVIDSMQAVLFGGVEPEQAAADAAAQMQAYIDQR